MKSFRQSDGKRGVLQNAPRKNASAAPWGWLMCFFSKILSRRAHPVFGSFSDPAQISPNASPTRRITSAAIQAMAHCPTTTPTAHLPPSSRLTEAMAATQGVYSRQKTKRLPAASGVRAAIRLPAVPKSTFRVETTLSFAIKPVIRAVEIRQSPSPRGLSTGAMHPATVASMLFWESSTRFMPKSKFCKNQMRIVARKMTVKARCKKSLALSQSRCATFLTPGIR